MLLHALEVFISVRTMVKVDATVIVGLPSQTS